MSVLLLYGFTQYQKIAKFKEKYFLALCNKQVEAILTGEIFATETRDFCGESWGRGRVFDVKVKVKVNFDWEKNQNSKPQKKNKKKNKLL